jgi:hypothetical protein
LASEFADFVFLQINVCDRERKMAQQSKVVDDSELRYCSGYCKKTKPAKCFFRKGRGNWRYFKMCNKCNEQSKGYADKRDNKKYMKNYYNTNKKENNLKRKRKYEEQKEEPVVYNVKALFAIFMVVKTASL